MCNIYSRTEKIIGTEKMQILKDTCIIVVGIGGVGSFVVEALSRVGIGTLILIDSKVIDETNINRQIHANRSTIGLKKVDVMKERIYDINPEIEVITYYNKYPFDGCDEILLKADYIVDAIDDVKGKLYLIEEAYKNNIKIISSMGTGNKLDPSAFIIDDIFSTSVCPLARVIRRELRKMNIPTLKVLYSKEEPLKTYDNEPGSISFVPSTAGLLIAGFVINDILEKGDI